EFANHSFRIQLCDLDRIMAAVYKCHVPAAGGNWHRCLWKCGLASLNYPNNVHLKWNTIRETTASNSCKHSAKYLFFTVIRNRPGGSSCDSFHFQSCPVQRRKATCPQRSLGESKTLEELVCLVRRFIPRQRLAAILGMDDRGSSHPASLVVDSSIW